MRNRPWASLDTVRLPRRYPRSGVAGAAMLAALPCYLAASSSRLAGAPWRALARCRCDVELADGTALSPAGGGFGTGAAPQRSTRVLARRAGSRTTACGPPGGRRPARSARCHSRSDSATEAGPACGPCYRRVRRPAGARARTPADEVDRFHRPATSSALRSPESPQPERGDRQRLPRGGRARCRAQARCRASGPAAPRIAAAGRGPARCRAGAGPRRRPRKREARVRQGPVPAARTAGIGRQRRARPAQVRMHRWGEARPGPSGAHGRHRCGCIAGVR
jgi:hypothetical protein